MRRCASHGDVYTVRSLERIFIYKLFLSANVVLWNKPSLIYVVNSNNGLASPTVSTLFSPSFDPFSLKSACFSLFFVFLCLQYDFCTNQRMIAVPEKAMLMTFPTLKSEQRGLSIGHKRACFSLPTRRVFCLINLACPHWEDVNI